MSTQQTEQVVPQWTLGDRLRKAREYAGLTQQGLANRMGVARNTVSNSENGLVEVRAITVNAWAVATGVPVAWLRSGRNPSGGPTDRYPLPTPRRKAA